MAVCSIYAQLSTIPEWLDADFSWLTEKLKMILSWYTGKYGSAKNLHSRKEYEKTRKKNVLTLAIFC